MPSDDVSDLKDVVDAINRLCETMKSSDCDELEQYEDCLVSEAGEPVAAPECVEWARELVGPEEVTVSSVQAYRAERWSDAEAAPACEAPGELYYTASDLSLLSDVELPDRVDDDAADKERKECVMAGHVAAMRERFESMTRTNTPCPELLRSASPSLDVFRNITPSPDRLG